MINNLEGQSKAELIKIIRIQCEETVVMGKTIKKLRAFLWDMLTFLSVILVGVASTVLYLVFGWGPV